MNWSQNITAINFLLKSLLAYDSLGNKIETDKAFFLWTRQSYKIRKNSNTIFLVGNGASASMASHMAADLANNAYVNTQVFTDISLMTAIANDVGYEYVFSTPLSQCMQKGDMLIAISSSGNSPNIIQAVKKTTLLGGTTITLSAMQKNNALSSLGDINFYLPAKTYGLAESCHAAILHFWADHIIEAVTKENDCAAQMQTKKRA